MARKAATLSIVFADISGSTRLYELLGDSVARELIAQCLGVMTEYIEKNGGRVIKTIGDEIMCTFPTADQAVEASMDMQEGVAEDLPEINVNTPSTMAIRDWRRADRSSPRKKPLKRSTPRFDPARVTWTAFR
jgi:class 3 adenylate cyclase